MSGVASPDRDRQGARRCPYREYGRGAQRRLARFGSQPFGTGPLSPRAALLLAHVPRVHSAPRALRETKRAAVAAMRQV